MARPSIAQAVIVLPIRTLLPGLIGSLIRTNRTKSRGYSGWTRKSSILHLSKERDGMRILCERDLPAPKRRLRKEVRDFCTRLLAKDAIWKRLRPNLVLWYKQDTIPSLFRELIELWRNLVCRSLSIEQFECSSTLVKVSLPVQNLPTSAESKTKSRSKLHKEPGPWEPSEEDQEIQANFSLSQW